MSGTVKVFITAADAAIQGHPDAYPVSDLPRLPLTATGSVPSLYSSPKGQESWM